MPDAVSSQLQENGVFTAEKPLRVVVLISGNGSNLQAIIDYLETHRVAAQVVKVISNKPDAYGLTRAKNAGIATQVLTHQEYDSREAYDQSLAEIIDETRPDLVVLAGFMRILTHAFVEHYLGRMINIHPSLLPKFKGLHTHQRALEAGESQHGCSVHIVTPELDDGPVILQASFDIKPGDTPESLAQHVHDLEHQIYPLVIQWFSQGRLRWDNNQVYLDNRLLSFPQQFEAQS